MDVQHFVNHYNNSCQFNDLTPTSHSRNDLKPILTPKTYNDVLDFEYRSIYCIDFYHSITGSTSSLHPMSFNDASDLHNPIMRWESGLLWIPIETIERIHDLNPWTSTNIMDIQH